MRVVAVSDLHLDEGCLRALLFAAEEADLVIVAGDIANNHEGLADYAQRLDPIAEKTIMVPGNNETVEALRDATRATVLHGESVERGGLVIGGVGGGIPPLPQAPFPSWDLSEEEAEEELGRIETADILVTHSPPKDIADRFDGRSIGSHAIRAAVERLQPKVHIFGHIHDCWGQRGRIGPTQEMNLGPVPVFFEVNP